MSDKKCSTSEALRGLIDKYNILLHRVEFMQMSIDLLEERLTHLEENITMEIEVEPDFELE